MSRILFICTSNKDRSRTAELLFRSERPEHEYRSAGINKFHTSQHRSQYITRELCEWADKIICMEDVHKKRIGEIISEEFFTKITVLHLGDTMTFNSEQLKTILRQKAEEKNIFS